jgi:hydrogenase expression/formation protein HypC
MCLAVPGKVLSIRQDDSAITFGKVSFGGILKEVCLAYVPDVQVGEYVIVHVGFAISRLDEEQAQEVFKYLKRMDELKELEEQAE